MSKYIKQKVKTCPTCQLTKRPLGPTYGELSQPPEAKEPFDLLSLDTIAGFAKYGNTKIYIHVVVDHFSRYAWTFPSKSTSITTYQQVLKRVLQDGSPKRLLTDRAPAFTSPKFSSFLLNRNIHPLLTTSNNPQANGLCERLNATLTGKLRLLHLENPKIAWTKLVKRVTVIYNKAPHSTTGFPPIYLMFGILPPELSDHSTPYPDIDKARKIAHTRTQNKHLQDKNIYDQRHKQPHFEVGDLVLVKLYHHPNTGKLAPYFTGPHTVLEFISPNVVRIDRPNQPLQRDTDTIHVNKLKLYTETVRYISPPSVRICHIKHKPDYTFPFKHFTPELFPAEPLRVKPTNSEPFRHLDPAIFSTRRFTPFFPDVKNCEPDNHFNPIILSQKRYTPLPNDNKQCEIERSTMNKVRTNISESPFTTTWKNMYQYPIFHLIFILCLLVLPYKCTPVLFLSYLLTYTMPSNRVFELQEAVFHLGQAFVKLIIILGSIFAENLNKFRGDRKCAGKPNEEYTTCGNRCSENCLGYLMLCTDECQVGCFCKKGFKRNSDGVCVKPELCDDKCAGKPNEEYTTCGSRCTENCLGYLMKCANNCLEGCFCKEGFKRNSEDVCVRSDLCDDKCAGKPNEEYSTCGNKCTENCRGDLMRCTSECQVGCFCKKGFKRNSDGVCVKSDLCDDNIMDFSMSSDSFSSTNKTTFYCPYGDETLDSPLMSQAPPIISLLQSCMVMWQNAKDGQMRSIQRCGNRCSESCQSHKKACTKECQSGCFCKKGYKRNKKGNCIKSSLCPKSCININMVQKAVAADARTAGTAVAVVAVILLIAMHDGRIRVWCHRGEGTLPACIVHRHTGPSPGVTVCDAIGYMSRSPVRIPGTIKSPRYISDVLRPIMFQQDYA
ncbi:hypothetical protein LAZ67_16001304 [Cordylochernes scorpioides]|uniref:Integrase catalytic domain-containing protein n=1 Tax=Cordylochernes scorpioides TaxID=51811 RepID=A0ABY6LCG4_9ARAC|nr:hypothetical protein LAZ67_16001304 [Cordylochernes scorpioides]